MSRADEMKKSKRNKKEKKEKKEEKNNKQDNKEINNKKIKNESNKDKNIDEKTSKVKSNHKTLKKICVFLIILLSIIFLVALSYFVYDNFFKESDLISNSLKFEFDDFRLDVVDLKSNTRPFAVMIDNNEDAWPQFNINEAMVVYEMLVEGGISRLLAIYKDKPKLEEIGPLRSARHYFLDYVKEYDAIYVHEGHSPRGGSEIYSRNIDSVEYTSGLFYRDPTRWAPHNAITSGQRMIDTAKANNFSLTTKVKPPLKYSVFPVKLKKSISATTIESGYSYHGDLKLVYNEDTKKYEKYELGELLKDAATDTPLAATNIIILNAKSYPLTGYGEGKSRVHVETDREMTGYFFTQGEGVKIKANKETVDSQTVYTLENGDELRINDGNTFIFLVPESKEIEIKGVEKELEVGKETEESEEESDKEIIEDEIETEFKAIEEETNYLEEFLKEKKVKIIRKKSI